MSRSFAIVCMMHRDGTVWRRAADAFDFLPYDLDWPMLCACLAAQGSVAAWVELVPEAGLTAGVSVEIQICERCGCDAFAWVHDERNEEHHALVPVKPSGGNGVYVVTALGDGSKPGVMKR